MQDRQLKINGPRGRLHREDDEDGGSEKALELLIDFNSIAPPNVKAAAARTLLELVGAIGSKAKNGDPGLGGDDLEPERMTVEDIERELKRLGQV